LDQRKRRILREETTITYDEKGGYFFTIETREGEEWRMVIPLGIPRKDGCYLGRGYLLAPSTLDLTCL